ncbi:MAG TPA: DUF493 family protein [Flavobacteriaceae bacterium]|nr:DUF493 family protein [Flavobacteriaceae bacterium]
MKDDINHDEFYDNLEKQLAEAETWPSEYLYKFIVPASIKKIAKIEKIFDHTGGEITTKDSSGGKYTSVTIRVEMDSPESVIDKYKEVGEQVEGVISL